MSEDRPRAKRVTVTDMDDPEATPRQLIEIQVSRDVAVRVTKLAAEKILELLEKTTYGGKE